VGRIPHDLRRAAVNNLSKAGIPIKVAMQMTGHETMSTHLRYRIVEEEDLQQAKEKMEARNGRVENDVLQVRKTNE